MDAATIAQYIGTLGFPIVTAAALFWYMVTENRAMTEAISNNTKVMTQILEHIKESSNEQ